jgi:hypothetical protein
MFVVYKETDLRNEYRSGHYLIFALWGEESSTPGNAKFRLNAGPETVPDEFLILVNNITIICGLI